jgi:opacity protein-like surface antigen
MRHVYLPSLLCAFSLTLFAIPASAQDARVRLSIGTAATTGPGDNVAITASAGYRFFERLSFDVDFMATESPGGDFVRPFAAIGGPGGGIMRGNVVTRGGPGFPGGPMERIERPMDPMRGRLFDRAIFPPAPPVRDRGDLTVVTAGFRYELPVQGGRLRPYVGGGLGLARTNQDVMRILARPGIDNSVRAAESIVRTGMAASAGAGASLRVFRGLFVDLDARYFRLDADRDLTRLGGGVSYRF